MAKGTVRHQKKVKKVSFWSKYGLYIGISLAVLLGVPAIGIMYWPNPNVPRPQPKIKPGKIAVTDDKGVTKDIIRRGSGKPPVKGDKVKINFNMTYPNGTLIASTNNQPPYEFELGDKKILPGINLALESMKVNETSRFVITSKYAYGERGSRTVQPGTNVVMSVELVEIIKKEETETK